MSCTLALKCLTVDEMISFSSSRESTMPTTLLRDGYYVYGASGGRVALFPAGTTRATSSRSARNHRRATKMHSKLSATMQSNGIKTIPITLSTVLRNRFNFPSLELYMATRLKHILAILYRGLGQYLHYAPIFRSSLVMLRWSERCLDRGKGTSYTASHSFLSSQF